MQLLWAKGKHFSRMTNQFTWQKDLKLSGGSLKSLKSRQIKQAEVVDFSVCQRNCKAKFTLTWGASAGKKLLGRKRRAGAGKQHGNPGFTWNTSNRFAPLVSLHERSPSLRTGASSFRKIPSLYAISPYSLANATLFPAPSLVKFILQTSDCGANYI